MAYVPPDQFKGSEPTYPPNQYMGSEPVYPPNQYMGAAPIYPPNNQQNFNMQYQPQGPSPPAYQPPPYAAQPGPSATMYPQPVVAQPLGGYLGHNPTPTQCAVCRQQVITQVQYQVSGITWLIAFLICFFGGALGCCFIPFCIPGCQDAVHTCPACHTTLGRKSPF